MNKRGMVVQKMQAKIGDDAVVQDKVSRHALRLEECV